MSNNLTREQQTTFFLPHECVDQDRRFYWDNAFDTFILGEDIYNGILPIGSRNEENWNVKLQPSDSNSLEIVTKALERGHHVYDLRSGLIYFLRECARDLIRYGESIYETAFFVNPELNHTDGFILAPVPIGSLKKYKGMWTQHLPLIVANRVGKPCEVPIDKDRLVFFELPASVAKDMDYMRTCLHTLSQHFMPDFGNPGIQLSVPSSERVPFDQSFFGLTRALAGAEVTRKIGYNFRTLNHEYCGDHYFYFREIRFHRFKIELRDAILLTLNHALQRIEETVGPLGQIVIEGLPTISDVEQAEKALQEGTQSISEIMKIFRLE